MAKGASGEYWSEPHLPSVFKHTLLAKYIPQFAGMAGSRSGRRGFVFLDGYAGRGRYADGSPASAERILQIAEHQGRSADILWNCFFVERDRESAEVLQRVVAEYIARGVTATTHRGDVESRLPDVVAAARGLPLFVFLDPCGIGLPYPVLVDLLGHQRAQTWPPTEVLINFSLEAVRRIGGHIASRHRDETSVGRLDSAVGGSWWHDLFVDGVSDSAVKNLVDQFARQLARDSGMRIVPTPVRRAPRHKPIYHLIFGTRSTYGLWVFGDSVAHATQAWWDGLEEVEAERDENALFTSTSLIRPHLKTVEADAVPVIADNLARLLDRFPSFKVVDHPQEVFGEYYGRVRDQVVRDAVRLLHRQGHTSSTGVGAKRPRDIIVARP